MTDTAPDFPERLTEEEAKQLYAALLKLAEERGGTKRGNVTRSVVDGRKLS